MSQRFDPLEFLTVAATLAALSGEADYEMMPPRPADRNWRANWLSAQALAARIPPRLQAL